MNLFVYDENIVKKTSNLRRMNKFAGVRYVPRNNVDVLGSDYKYFIGSYDELKNCRPDSYLVLSDESHVSSYNTGYVIGSDCFSISESDHGIDLMFRDDDYDVLEYIDDFANPENYKIVNRSSNYILRKYLELSNMISSGMIIAILIDGS